MSFEGQINRNQEVIQATPLSSYPNEDVNLVDKVRSILQKERIDVADLPWIRQCLGPPVDLSFLGEIISKGDPIVNQLISQEFTHSLIDPEKEESVLQCILRKSLKDEEIIKILDQLFSGWDPELKLKILNQPLKNADGFNILYSAVVNERFEVFKWLIDQGTDVFQLSKDYRTIGSAFAFLKKKDLLFPSSLSNYPCFAKQKENLERLWFADKDFIPYHPKIFAEFIDFLKENPEFIQSHFNFTCSTLLSGFISKVEVKKIVKFLTPDRISQYFNSPLGNDFLLQILQIATIQGDPLELISRLHEGGFEFNQPFTIKRESVPDEAKNPLLHALHTKKKDVIDFFLDQSIITPSQLLLVFLENPSFISSCPEYVYRIIERRTDLTLQGQDGRTVFDHIFSSKSPLKTFWAFFIYLLETQYPFDEGQKKALLEMANENDFSYIISLLNNKSSLPDNFRDSVTVRNMALLLGDATIRETKLEGGIQSKTLNFLSHGIAHLLEKETEYFKPKTREILAKCKGLIEKGSLLSERVEIPSNVSEAGMDSYLEKLSKMVLKDIKKLEIGESLLIPSGWFSLGTSHAILIRCKRISEDRMVFQLFNTGGGTSKYHQIEVVDDKVVLQTARYYELTDVQLKSSGLIQSLFEINTLGIMGNRFTDYKFNEEDLYHILDPYKISDENLIKKYGFSIDRGVMQTQLSGTCAMRSILAYLRYELGDKEYKKFLSLLKREVADAALDKFGKELSQSIPLKKVLGKALPSLFRSEQKIADFSNPQTLSPEERKQFYLEKEEIVDFLLELENKFSSQLEKKKPSIELIPEPHPQPTMTQTVSENMEFDLTNQDEKPTPFVDSTQYSSFYQFCPNEMLKSPDALYETLFAINNLGNPNLHSHDPPLYNNWNETDKMTLDRRDILENTLMQMGREMIKAQQNKQDHPFFVSLKSNNRVIQSELAQRCIDEISYSVGTLVKFHGELEDPCSAATTIALHYALVSAWIIATSFEETLQRPPEGLLSNYRLSGQLLGELYVNEEGANLIANKRLEEDYHRLLTFFQKDQAKQTIFDFEKIRRSNPFQDIIPIETDSGEYLLAETYPLSEDEEKKTEIEYSGYTKRDPEVPALDPQVWKNCWACIHGLPDYLNKIRFISEASVVLNPKQKTKYIGKNSIFDPLVLRLSVKKNERGEPYFKPCIVSKNESWLLPHTKHDLKPEKILPEDERVSYELIHLSKKLAIKPNSQNSVIRTPYPSHHAPMEIRTGTSQGELGIPFLFNYFKQNHNLLTENHFRILFTTTLYQPFKLKEALNKYSNLEATALEFFQFAIQFLKQQEQCGIEVDKTQEAIVFLLDQQQRFLQWLPQKQAETLLPNIQKQIRDYQKKIQNSDLVKILSRSLVESYEIKQILNSNEIQEIFTQYYEIMKGYPLDDGITRAALRSAGCSFAKHFPQIIESFSDESSRNHFLNNFLNDQGVGISSDAKWTSYGFPYFKSEIDGYSYLVDLMQQKIYRNTVPLIAYNTSLDNDSQYQAVFGSTSIDWKNFGTYFEGNFNGEQVQVHMTRFSIKHIDRCIKDKWHRMMTPFLTPLHPKKLIGSDHLQYWLDLESGDINVLDKKSQTSVLRIQKNGSFELPSRETTSPTFEWVDLKEFPPAKFFLKFDSSAILWQNKETQNLLLQFPTYTDERGNPLEFELKTSHGKQRWVWKQLPHLFISPNQQIEHLSDQTNILVLENAIGKKECLVSIQNIDSRPDRGMCLHIPLKDNKLITRKPYQNLILAYIALSHASLPSDYELALNYLKEGYKFESYTAEELKILGWIFKPSKKNPDHSGYSTTLKIYAAWLVQDNFARHPNAHEKKPLSNDRDYPNLYDREVDWITFWQDRWKIKSMETFSSLLEDLIINYKTQKKKIPISLRIESILAAHEIQKLKYQNSTRKILDPQLLKQQIKVKSYYYFPDLEKVLEKMKEHLPASKIKYHTRPGKGIIKNFSILVKKFSAIEKGRHEDFKEAEQFLLDMIFTKDDETLGYILILFAVLYKDCLHPDLIINVDIKKINELIAKGKKVKAKTMLNRDFLRGLNAFAEHLLKYYAIHIETPSFKTTVHGQHSSDWLEPTPKPVADVTLHYQPENSTEYFDYINGLHQKYFTESDATTSKSSPFSLKTEDPFIVETLKILNEDYKAGCEKNETLKNSHFKDSNLVAPFILEVKNSVQEDYKITSAQLNALEKEILFIANKLPDDHQKAFEAKVARHAGIKPKLTMKECIALFLQGNIEEFKRLTHLESAEEIQTLYKKIGRYQQLSLTCRHQAKILDKVEKLEKHLKTPHTSQKEIQSILASLEEDLKLNHEMTDKDPAAFLTFQYCLGILLRPDQVEGLHEMLLKHEGEFRNVLLQRIQGGGKTLVFGHLMALLKADGKHLSIHIPPTSLYHSSLYDMKHLSQNVFGQKEKSLEFDDHPSLFTEDYLKEMTSILQNAILNREYVTITQESLRAMRCKYLKVRFMIMQINEKIRKLKHENRQNKNSKIENQIYNLEVQERVLETKNQKLKNILKILREHAVFTFDEVDMAFDPHKELNMPVGDVFPPDQLEGLLIAKTIRLAAEAKDPKTGNPLLSFKGKQESKQSSDDFKKMGQYITDQLVSSKKWQKLFKAETAEKQAALKDYFQNRSAELPAFVREMKQDTNGLGPQAAELIILTHNLIAEKWLRKRLKKSVDEHHGITYDYEMQKAKVSIPYIANMNPSLGSEFSNKHVMLINTFISYAVSGINHSQTLELIKKLQERGREEYLNNHVENPLLTLQDTQPAKMFEETGAGLLYSIDLKNPKEIERIQKCMNNNLDISRKLIFEYVIHEEIPKVELYPYQISSHGQNTASMAKAFIGYSGSLDNPNLAPINTTIQFEKGTNGQTIDLIVSKFDAVHTVSSNAESLLKEIIKIHPQKEDVRAIIDVGAHFRGIPNQDVAEMICRFLYQEGLPCEGVLYFNTQNEKLMVMYASPPYLTKELTGTDAETIESETNCKLKNLFVYYDQNHTIGTNITLNEKAVGILTISENTPIHKMIQGARRLRGLDKEQKIVFAIQKNLLPLISNKIKKQSPLTSKDLVLFTHINEAEAMREDNLLYCLQKMENVVQQFILDKLYDRSPEEEKRIFSVASYLFAKNITQDLYELYAKNKKEKEIKKYLQHIQKCLLDPLQKILKEKEYSTLQTKIESVIEEALPTLRKKIEVSEDFKNQKNSGNHYQDMESSHVQFREQKNTQTKENDRKQEIEKSSENLAEVEYNTYKNSSLYVETACLDSDLLKQEFQNLTVPVPEHHDFGGFQIWNANEALERQLQKKHYTTLLDEEILVTSNFSKTLAERINLVGSFKKTPAYGLLLQDKNGWRLILGSLQDTKFFENLIRNEKQLPEGRSAHLISFPDTLLLSIGENLPDDPKIKRLIVQVLFYSGQLNVLRQEQWSSELAKWLKDKSNIEVYRDFFENVAMSSQLDNNYHQSNIFRILNP